MNMTKYRSRAEYTRETRKCISLQNETYDAVLEIKDILENINRVFPFTAKVISQQDTVQYLCKFFLSEYQDLEETKLQVSLKLLEKRHLLKAMEIFLHPHVLKQKKGETNDR